MASQQSKSADWTFHCWTPEGSQHAHVHHFVLNVVCCCVIGAHLSPIIASSSSSLGVSCSAVCFENVQVNSVRNFEQSCGVALLNNKNRQKHLCFPVNQLLVWLEPT